MGQMPVDCPHCGTKRVSFITFGEVQKVDKHQYTVGLYCAGCYGGIVAEFRYKGGTTPVEYLGNLREHKTLELIKIYPVAAQTQSPKYLPENLDKFYQQAATTLSSANYDASAMMSRKVLEVAVKVLDSDGEGSLYKRIEKLAKKSLITNDLKDWAHIIRDDGNAAAHEEEPVSKAFAQELLSFAEMFLMYTFTMPNMIKERRHDDELLSEG